MSLIPPGGLCCFDQGMRSKMRRKLSCREMEDKPPGLEVTKAMPTEWTQVARFWFFISDHHVTQFWLFCGSVNSTNHMQSDLFKSGFAPLSYVILNQVQIWFLEMEISEFSVPFTALSVVHRNCAQAAKQKIWLIVALFILKFWIKINVTEAVPVTIPSLPVPT